VPVHAPVPAPASNRVLVILPVLMVVVVLALIVLLVRRQGGARSASSRIEPMSDAQREAALQRLRQWLAAEGRPAAVGAGVRDVG
jgi:cytochrome c-type biogenesis protein CcmH/NrfF